MADSDPCLPKNRKKGKEERGSRCGNPIMGAPPHPCTVRDQGLLKKGKKMRNTPRNITTESHRDKGEKKVRVGLSLGKGALRSSLQLT